MVPRHRAQKRHSSDHLSKALAVFVGIDLTDHLIAAQICQRRNKDRSSPILPNSLTHIDKGGADSAPVPRVRLDEFPVGGNGIVSGQSRTLPGRQRRMGDALRTTVQQPDSLDGHEAGGCCGCLICSKHRRSIREWARFPRQCQTAHWPTSEQPTASQRRTCGLAAQCKPRSTRLLYLPAQAPGLPEHPVRTELAFPGFASANQAALPRGRARRLPSQSGDPQ